jgi:hypothetical protein
MASKNKEVRMDAFRIYRGVMGFFIIVSLVLAVFFSWWWLLLALLIAIDLFQSVFTDICPVWSLLKRLGFRTGGSDKQM